MLNYLDFAGDWEQNLLVESKQNYSWIGKLMMGIMSLLLAFIGVATIFQIQVGNITIIWGDDNTVEHGSQIQTVNQPAKLESRAPATAQPVSEQTTYPVKTVPVQEITAAPSVVAENSPVRNYSARRTTPVDYETDEECSCPTDDEEEEEYEPEPPPQYTRRVYINNSVSNRAVDTSTYSQAHAQSSVSVQGRNVSVQSSATGGQTRTRIVVNGKVIVDQ